VSEILTIESGSPERTEALAAELGGLLREGDLLLLRGELGAGKTCFARGLARGAGADPRGVSSPTYVIAHEYEGRGLTLVHVDAYRLSEDDDLEALGVDLDSPGAAAAVEWPERLWPEDPPGALAVAIGHAGGENRSITISGSEVWATRLAAIRT